MPSDDIFFLNTRNETQNRTRNTVVVKDRTVHISFHLYIQMVQFIVTPLP